MTLLLKRSFRPRPQYYTIIIKKQFQPYCKLGIICYSINRLTSTQTSHNIHLKHSTSYAIKILYNYLVRFAGTKLLNYTVNILENCFYILSPIIFLTINLSLSESSCNPIIVKHESVPGVHSLYSYEELNPLTLNEISSISVSSCSFI